MTRFIEEALLYDYNMMIEEHQFYTQLTPRLQEELVQYLFHDF